MTPTLTDYTGLLEREKKSSDEWFWPIFLNFLPLRMQSTFLKFTFCICSCTFLHRCWDLFLCFREIILQEVYISRLNETLFFSLFDKLVNFWKHFFISFFTFNVTLVLTFGESIFYLFFKWKCWDVLYGLKCFSMYMQYIKTTELWWISENKWCDAVNCQKHTVYTSTGKQAFISFQIYSQQTYF